jgi:hypothetical protein
MAGVFGVSEEAEGGMESSSPYNAVEMFPPKQIVDVKPWRRPSAAAPHVEEASPLCLGVVTLFAVCG